jgi:hypothetical protein
MTEEYDPLSDPEHWTSGTDLSYLSDGDRKLLSRYDSMEKALPGLCETARKVGSSIRWPDEKSTPEDKDKFDAKVNEYLGVPSTIEGYEFDKSVIPEHIQYDEEMANEFRQWMADEKVPKSKAADLFKKYGEFMVGRHKAIDEVTKHNEAHLREKWGTDYEKKIGTEEMPGLIKQRLVQLSKELGMDYQDAEGNLQSRLIDDLEMVGKNGVLGDKIAIIEALDHLLDYRYKEATTHLGEPVTAGKTSKETFSDDWYSNPTPGED